MGLGSRVWPVSEDLPSHSGVTVIPAWGDSLGRYGNICRCLGSALPLADGFVGKTVSEKILDY